MRGPEHESALVAGGTGLTGGHLLRELAASDRYRRVIALSRRTMQAPAGVTVLQAPDFAHLPGLPPITDVYCALGTTMRKAGSREAFRQVDYGYPLELARAAKAAGGRRFLLVSSVGADAASSNFYLKVKGELEQALALFGFEELHVFRPGVLLGERGESRPGEAIGRAVSVGLGALLPGPLRKYRAMEAARLARAMVRAAGSGARGLAVYHYDEIVALAG